LLFFRVEFGERSEPHSDTIDRGERVIDLEKRLNDPKNRALAKAATFAEDGFHPHTPTMQTATKSDQNIVLPASQETGKNYRRRTIIYHRDGTVRLWDVFSQSWVRTADPNDQLLDGLPRAELDRIKRYLLNGISALTVR
jgi:hypothetical protein